MQNHTFHINAINNAVCWAREARKRGYEIFEKHGVIYLRHVGSNKIVSSVVRSSGAPLNF
jgi:hypothetical protein